ncbi:hypothetical protein [Desulfovibrio desulfuricans]|uniref:hypothetical protein n=1 Tax=Desulfovibrio desulfuricans TaxID=876 RepID=UPI00042279BC|nr:hypothetical protein [Desulfovibrio desulfuricans]MDD3683252.1 hypothetical protein [Desulfovibrio desulfuricans]QTO39334.1 hypothetical protein J8J02_09275 [Desulfovibrio desulfuricans]
MVLSRICALLCLGCLLAGCGTTRPVVVVEKDEFMKMAHNMPKELQARDLLDKDGSYTAPMSFKGLKDYGDILFTRLSPSFMLQNDTAHDVYLGETFSATILPDSRVQRFPNGFSINHATQKLKVNMVGIADWNGDGQDEWIVSCFVEPKRGGRTRIYYVLVPPPLNDQEKLKGTVAAVYECFGLSCTLYVRDSKVIQRDAADPLLPPTEVHDVVPGLQPVTTPPDKAKQKSGEGLEERSL